MPRPRLTLGRLMAWIAFASLNLAVLGTLYRIFGPSQHWSFITCVMVWLALLNLISAFALFQLRDLWSRWRDPARDSQQIAWGLYLSLAITTVFLVILAMPMILLAALGPLH